MKNMFKLGLVAALSLGLQAPSAAQAQVRLKMAHGYAESHYHSVEGLRKIANELEKRTNGEVVVDIFPAYQLGKAHTTLLNSGVVDMAFVTPPQEPDKFPLSSIMEMPALFSGSCDMTSRLWPLMRPGGEIYRQEYATQGYRPIYLGMMAQYDLYTAAKPVKTVADLEGLKLRGNGGTAGKILRSLEAVPVTLASSDVYDAASRGTIDGMYYPASGIFPYSLETVVRHGVTGLQLGAAGSLLVISDKAYKRLSPQAQEALTAIGEEMQQSFCQYIDSNDAALRQRLVSESGLSLLSLSPEESAAWSARVGHVVTEWVDEMRRARRDGAAVLSALGYQPAAQN